MASDSPATDSLAILADVWRAGRTGVLLLHSARACTEIAVVGGGLVDVARLSEVRRAVETGRLRFALRTAAPGQLGDRAALGGLVLDLHRGRTAHPLRPLDSDDMVRLALPPDLLVGLASDQLLDRLAHKAVAVGALVRDGSATVAELRALEALDAVAIAGRASEARAPARRPAPPPPMEEEDEEEVLAVVMEAEDLIPVPAAPALAPPPVLRLLEDEDELLALHGDDDELDADELDADELDADALDADALDAGALGAHQRGGAAPGGAALGEDADELLALGEPDAAEGELDGDSVLRFGDLDDALDLDLLGMPEADEEALAAARAAGHAVIDWGSADEGARAHIAAIEDRVSATGVRADARRGAAELDATPFGDVQTEAVWGAVEPTRPRGSGAAATWGEDPPTEESLFDALLADEHDEDPETAQDPLRAVELAHDDPTDDGDAEWSLASASVGARSRRAGARQGGSAPDEHTSDEDTEDGLFLGLGTTQEEETTGYRGAAFPEELSGVLQGARLRARDEITAGFQLDLINRARQELERGRLADARAALERAEVLFPGDPTVEVHLAWVDLLDGRDDGAARRAMHAVSEAPLDPVIQRLAVALSGHVGTTFRG